MLGLSASLLAGGVAKLLQLLPGIEIGILFKFLISRSNEYLDQFRAIKETLIRWVGQAPLDLAPSPLRLCQKPKAQV